MTLTIETTVARPAGPRPVPVQARVPKGPFIIEDGLPVKADARGRLKKHYNTPMAEHGTPGRYHYWGCRCTACTEAHRIMRKRHRHGRHMSVLVSATATLRMLRGLNRIGFSAPAIAGRIGMNADRVQALTTRGTRTGKVHERTADALAAAYEDMIFDAPPVDDPVAIKIRRRAERLGWDHPDAWTDETIKDPQAKPYDHLKRKKAAASPAEIFMAVDLINRQPMSKTTRKPALWGPLNYAERAEVLRTLAGQGMTINRMALNLGVHVGPLMTWITKYTDAEISDRGDAYTLKFPRGAA